MKLASLRDLFGYGLWANRCVWDTAADVNDEQLDRSFELGEGSLRKTLAHIYGAERAWHERCAGPEAEALPRGRETHSLAEIREATGRISRVRDDWLASFSNADLDREIAYDKDGHTYAHPLSDVLLHVCNHGMHHRAQALNMLRRMGKKVPVIDLLIMRMKEAGRPAMRTDLATVRTYYEYTDWANGRVFDIAETLSDEQLRRPFEMGMGSILKTLAHIRDAEQWWLQNWNGSTEPFQQIERKTTIRQLHDAHTQTIHARSEYVSALNDADLQRTVTARPLEDKTYTFALGESMLQLCNHGTHHRAQIINMFRHTAAEVPTLDYIAMKRQGATA